MHTETRMSSGDPWRSLSSELSLNLGKTEAQGGVACPEVHGSSVSSKTRNWALDGCRVLLPPPIVLSTCYLPGTVHPHPHGARSLGGLADWDWWVFPNGHWQPLSDLTSGGPSLTPTLSSLLQPAHPFQLRTWIIKPPSSPSSPPPWLILSYPHTHPLPPPKKLSLEPRHLGSNPSSASS